MIALEIAGAVVIVALGLTVTWMAIVGLMGITGAIHLRRCRTCRHLVTDLPRMVSSCPYCRHPHSLGQVFPVRLHHFLPGDWQP